MSFTREEWLEDRAEQRQADRRDMTVEPLPRVQTLGESPVTFPVRDFADVLADLERSVRAARIASERNAA